MAVCMLLMFSVKVTFVILLVKAPSWVKYTIKIFIQFLIKKGLKSLIEKNEVFLQNASLF